MAKGCNTYVDALTAIEAFRREVERACKDAYIRHEKRLLETMGLELDECKLYDHADYLEDRLVELGSVAPPNRASCCTSTCNGVRVKTKRQQ